MRNYKILVVSLLFSVGAHAKVDFKKVFADRDACFVVADLKSGKIIAEHNPERCQKRFTPCSSFKVAAALMAFEKGILKSETQKIPWDGRKRGRDEENRDQTPLSWMNQSIKWVTEWITPQLGRKTIERFLKSFHYGNEDFSGGLKDAWVSSSLKISAREQLAFMTRLWKGDLPLAKSTIEHTKNIIIIKKVGSSELYGKTGTGCLVGHACMDRPDKMIGTFVGVLMNGDHPYVVAANASDLKDQNRPAGPRLRDSTIEILTELGLAERDCAYCDGKR